jgi:elongation factor G
MEFPVTGVKVTINDGQFPQRRFPDLAFQRGRGGGDFKEAYLKAETGNSRTDHEGLVETPTAFQGAVMGL